MTGAEYAENFADLHPPLTTHEAFVEAERCYFCHEPPCQKACPTGIDIAMFIRQIAAGNAHGAAETIFSANVLGGMCARVCPTETLCEEACVREAAEGKPVKIGLLQRHATDALMASGKQPFRPRRRHGQAHRRASARARRASPARISLPSSAMRSCSSKRRIA